MRFATRKSALRLGIVALIFVLIGAACYWTFFAMPGRSYTGVVVVQNSELSAELRRHVEMLATKIGPRGTFKPDAYAAAAAYIEDEFRQMGYEPVRQDYEAGGMTCANIIAEIPGGAKADEILIVGAHYDSIPGCPAANDNASGVAGVLVLARMLHDSQHARTIRFIAFANEEMPYFHSDAMGALVYARACKARGENLVGMISLETIGYYSDERGSQRYPAPLDLLYPDVGNFIAFVGNVQSRSFVQEMIGGFREHAAFPSEGAALPEGTPGINLSDHWAFWEMGYEAIMISDTAPFRYPHYHTPQDTPDKLDFPRLAVVISGVEKALRDVLNK